MRVDTKSPAYVILYAGVMSAAFTAAIMAFHTATADIVRRNEQLLEYKAIVEIFFGRDKLAQLSDEEIARTVDLQVHRRTITDPLTGRDMELLLAYSAERTEGQERDGHDLVGYGFGVSGVGFWARIDGLVAAEPDLGRIKGIYFLTHSETPGLGGMITSEKFKRGFVGRDISPPPEGEKYIYIDRDRPSGPGEAQFGRHVDAITGATGTSTAVEDFLNDDIAAFRRAMAAAGLPNPVGED